MEKSRVLLLIIPAIIIIVALVVVASGSISIGSGYKVTIKGTAYYNMITGWGVSYGGNIIQEDSLFSVMWYWPWETKDVQIKVELRSTDGGVYHGETWVGTLSSIVGSREFAAELRHVPVGSYTGTIYIYEVEKIWFGLSEGGRNLRGTCSISQIDIN